LLVQRAESGAGEVADLVELGMEQLRQARNAKVGVTVLTSSVDEFMRSVEDEPDWVVPGLLARGDRLVLTGSGGLGKSTLLRQVAVCAAAGIDPLDWHTGKTFDPVKVTILDHENSDHQLKTRLWPMLKETRAAGRPVEDRLTVGGHGNPLNLLDASTALSLLRTIEHDQPDLVYIGPVYKLHNDDPDKEVVVKKITHVLDQIRATGAALITEAHHTKASKQGGSLEPSGSNLWTWWPELGFGLRLMPDSDASMRLCSLERWRLDRVQTTWPNYVNAGGPWPWQAVPDNPFYGAG
jgi:RecA-family ATPase